ncbi:MAG TPA: hypothetical protein VGX49_05635, partial [Jatrophihabitans sp.]|nr:hypothetical protein [Jatrophihabitans sp.]
MSGYLTDINHLVQIDLRSELEWKGWNLVSYSIQFEAADGSVQTFLENEGLASISPVGKLLTLIATMLAHTVPAANSARYLT